MRISDWSSDVCSSDLDRCRSGGGGAAGAWRDLAAAAVQPDERRPCALGAHPARLRTVRPQCVGDGAPPAHAPAHATAYSRDVRAEELTEATSPAFSETAACRGGPGRAPRRARVSQSV